MGKVDPVRTAKVGSGTMWMQEIGGDYSDDDDYDKSSLYSRTQT